MRKYIFFLIHTIGRNNFLNIGIEKHPKIYMLSILLPTFNSKSAIFVSTFKNSLYLYK